MMKNKQWIYFGHNRVERCYVKIVVQKIFIIKFYVAFMGEFLFKILLPIHRKEDS